ncbi:MAG: HD domain-containing protein [Clostridia bacterium]|nr:HD domain-containing protein [Clostridia bacterium]
MKNIDYYKEYFKNYALQYINMCDKKEDKTLVEYKLAHTYRVRDNMLRIAKSCQLAKHDIHLAEVIGLFHDIGRFKQYIEYGSYDDKSTVNHAIYSAQIIKEENILKDLSCEDFNIVYKAIYYHNVYKVEKIDEKLTQKEIYFLNMIRDADRLDIYKGMAESVPKMNEEERYIWYNERENTEEISDLIYEQILSDISPSMKDCKTIVESQFARMSWIFEDFHFKEAIHMIIQGKYFEKIYEDMKKSNRANEMYEHMMKCLYDIKDSLEY